MNNLSALSVLKISGEDAANFLQGQLTNDVHEAQSGWQFSAYCNPKGRVLALFYVWQFQNKFYLVVPESLSESVSKRLRMYILRSKVSLELLDNAVVTPLNAPLATGTLDCGPDHALLGFDAASLLITFEPQTNDQNPRHETLSPMADKKRPVDAEPMKQINWKNLMVSQGMPMINSATSELFVPQMLNLDILGGVSFTKGCYTGQEIVARMHYLGKLKQRLFQLSFDNKAELTVREGEKVITQDNKSLGHVVNVAVEAKRVLAVLRTEETDDPTNSIKTESGVPLTVLASYH